MSRFFDHVSDLFKKELPNAADAVTAKVKGKSDLLSKLNLPGIEELGKLKTLAVDLEKDWPEVRAFLDSAASDLAKFAPASATKSKAFLAALDKGMGVLDRFK